MKFNTIQGHKYNKINSKAVSILASLLREKSKN